MRATSTSMSSPPRAQFRDKQPYAVPAKGLSTWVVNDPLGYVGWVERIDMNGEGSDADGDGRFVRSCRMMKRWRDQFFADGTGPSSILLVTMLGKHDPSRSNYSPALKDPLFPQYQTDMAYLFDMVRLTHSCLISARRSAFMHPTITDEDLGPDWDETRLIPFMARLRTFIDHIRNGIYATDDKTALEHYAKAFGATFPTS